MRRAALSFAALLMLSASTASADPLWNSTRQMIKSCSEGSLDNKSTTKLQHWLSCNAFLIGVMRGQQMMGEKCVNQYSINVEDVRGSLNRYVEKLRETGSGQEFLNKWEKDPHVIVSTMLGVTYPCKKN